MDATHLHLVLNHFPIIGTLIGLGILLYGFIRSSESVKQAALGTWILMALIAIPVFLTGEPAEETVEGLTGISESVIHDHEEAAEIAIWLMAGLGVLSLATLLLLKYNQAFSKTLMLVTLVAAVITFGGMARTGYLGGQIRHSELSTTSTVQPADDHETRQYKEEKDDVDFR